MTQVREISHQGVCAIW